MLRILLLIIAVFFILGIIIAGMRQRKKISYHETVHQDPIEQIEMVDEDFEPKIGEIVDIMDESVYCPHPIETKMAEDYRVVTKETVQKPIEVMEVAKEVSQVSDKTPQSKSESYDDLILFYIMAPTGRKFIGYELLQSILATGMQQGDDRMFHYYEKVNAALMSASNNLYLMKDEEMLPNFHVAKNKKQATMFTLASLNETGEIDINSIGGFATSGLCLFLNIHYKKPLFAFKTMLQIIQQLSDDLGGTICDIRQRPGSQQYLEECHHKILKFLAAKNEKYAVVS